MIQKNWQELVKPNKLQVSFNPDTPNEAIIVADPLEKGFGLTLGNALRRVLLSSLRGAAITSIKAEGVAHEFAVIPGVQEDFADIIMNLKLLSIKMHTELPKKLVIDAKGPGVVYAKDIQTPSDVEIVNKDLVICTLDNGANLKMELNCEPGKGYVTAAANRKEGMPVGTIAIDSIFSPVLQVAYRVEHTRVGQVTDYDKLIMTVKTNGTLTPEDAVARAARILQEYLINFINFEEPQLASDKNGDIAGSSKLPFNPQLLRRLDEFDLSMRAFNCLRHENMVYVGDLVIKKEEQLLNTPNFGLRSLEDIKKVLSEIGLTLGMEVPGWPPENIDELSKTLGDEVYSYSEDGK